MLYSWYSDYLRNYRAGKIIVSAEDVETAREIARKGFEIYEKNRSYFDQDYFTTLKDIFEKDISVEPKIEPNFIFIEGSE